VSAVLGVLEPGEGGAHPVLMVQCSCCQRVYRSRAAVAEVERQAFCSACRPKGVAARMWTPRSRRAGRGRP
jgi:hypothetical protein